MEPEEMDWWDVVSDLLNEVDYWDTDFSEEITPHQASEHLLEVLRDADMYQAKLRARAEAAEAERDRMRLALRIIAGQEQCADNLMSHADIARAALSGGDDA